MLKFLETLYFCGKRKKEKKRILREKMNHGKPIYNPNRSPTDQSYINLKRSLEQKTQLVPEVQEQLANEFKGLAQLNYLNTDMFAITLWFLYDIENEPIKINLVPEDFKTGNILKYASSLGINNSVGAENQTLLLRVKANIYSYAKFINKIRPTSI